MNVSSPGYGYEYGGAAALASLPRAAAAEMAAAARAVAGRDAGASVDGALLGMALDSQSDLAMKLLKAGLEQLVVGDKMEIAGQIIDAYA